MATPQEPADSPKCRLCIAVRRGDSASRMIRFLERPSYKSETCCRQCQIAWSANDINDISLLVFRSWSCFRTAIEWALLHLGDAAGEIWSFAVCHVSLFAGALVANCRRTRLKSRSENQSGRVVLCKVVSNSSNQRIHTRNRCTSCWSRSQANRIGSTSCWGTWRLLRWKGALHDCFNPLMWELARICGERIDNPFTLQPFFLLADFSIIGLTCPVSDCFCTLTWPGVTRRV